MLRVAKGVTSTDPPPPPPYSCPYPCPYCTLTVADVHPERGWSKLWAAAHLDEALALAEAKDLRTKAARAQPPRRRGRCVRDGCEGARIG